MYVVCMLEQLQWAKKKPKFVAWSVWVVISICCGLVDSVSAVCYQCGSLDKRWLWWAEEKDAVGDLGRCTCSVVPKSALLARRQIFQCQENVSVVFSAVVSRTPRWMWFEASRHKTQILIQFWMSSGRLDVTIREKRTYLFMGAMEIAFRTSSLISGVSTTPGHTQLTLILCSE